MVERENFVRIAQMMECVTEFRDFPDNSPEKQVYNNKRDDYIRFLGVFVGCGLAEAMYSETLLLLKKWDNEDETTTKECRELHDSVHAVWARHWFMTDPRVEVQPPGILGPNAAWESTRYEYGMNADENVPGCSVYSSLRMATSYLPECYVVVY